MFDSTDWRNIVPAAGKANHALITSATLRRGGNAAQIARLSSRKPWIVPIHGTTKLHRPEGISARLPLN
jgi:hypothetical protein